MANITVLTSFILFFAYIALFSICSYSKLSKKSNIVSLPFAHSIEVIHEFPHDDNAFTQGILYGGNNTLFESTGLYGKSSVRKVSLQHGKVEIIHMMDGACFGEGLALIADRLFQVSWMSKKGFIYDKETLREVGAFVHGMQDGWGLTTDGNVFYGSDGTSKLYHLDTQTFEVVNEHVVRHWGHEIRYLNELEFVDGEVWANIWQTDCIARISTNGTVLGWILLDPLRNRLLNAGFKGFDVLNGIAWDSAGSRIFVTGKLWPRLYEIKLKPLRKPLTDRAIIQHCIPQ